MGGGKPPEPGGKSPTIVMPDADLAEAATHAISIGFANSGQTCIAATRILVPRASLADSCTALKTAMAGVVQGNPRTTLGPLANRRRYERLLPYIREGLDRRRHADGRWRRPP